MMKGPMRVRISLGVPMSLMGASFWLVSRTRGDTITCARPSASAFKAGTQRQGKRSADTRLHSPGAQ